VLAPVRPAADALAAMPAVRKPSEEDVVAGSQAGHAGADLFHDPRTLVSEDDRQRGRVDPLRGVEVGVADAARRDPDENLPRLRRIEVELLDDEGLAEGVEDGRPDYRGTTRTGSDLKPLMKFELSRTGGPVSSKRTPRARISSSRIRISSRARNEPRQKCGPPRPNVTCGFGSRATSNRRGSAKTSSSKLAERYQSATRSPVWMGTPRISVSRVAVRRK